MNYSRHDDACESSDGISAERSPRGQALQVVRAKLDGGNLQFPFPIGLRQSFATGCFFLEIPRELDLAPGITLCREFYLDQAMNRTTDNPYRGFKGKNAIYFDREHYQTEHILIDRPGRHLWFPPELLVLCEKMNDISICILREALIELHFPESDWARVTGEAINNAGTHWFAASHYRPERNQLGCAPHKDTGFVTVLYMSQPGLEVFVDNQWVPIDPLPKHFLINFGGAFEILTRRTKNPVHSILHRVGQTKRELGEEDRFSFAAFTNPPADRLLFEYDEEGALYPYMRVSEFLSTFNEATWKDRHSEFGIK